MSADAAAETCDRAHGEPVSELSLSVYSSSVAVGSPRALLAQMFEDLQRSRELGWRLFVRDVSAQYRQSLLGVAWAIAPALLMAGVFIVLHARNIIVVGETGVPYPVFALVGTLYWQVFVDALNAPLKSASGAKSILSRIQFPREALILSALYTVLFGALLKGVVLVALLVYFGIPFHAGSLLALVALAGLIVLGLGLGLALTPLGLLYTDVSSALVVIVQVGFFVTPVVYPAPQSWPMNWVSVLNPVSPLLSAARDWTTLGAADPLPALAMGALACVGFLAGWIFYRVALPLTIERLGA